MSDLQELFERDPMQLTRDDVKSIVEGLRALRKTFNVTGSAPKIGKQQETHKFITEVEL